MSDKSRTYLFNISALLLLAGAVLFLPFPVIAPYLFAVGAAGITLSFLTVSHKDLNVRQRRLQRFNVMGSVLMIAASTLMFNNRNEWIICLTIAAIFIGYSSFAWASAGKE